MKLDLPLCQPSCDIYDIKGVKMKMSNNKTISGQLSIEINIPSIYRYFSLIYYICIVYIHIS